MKVESKLSAANAAFRGKNYPEALELYLQLLAEVGSSYPTVILSIVQHNIEVCKKALQLGGSPGERATNPFVISVNPSHTHPTEIEFWTGVSATLHASGITMIDMAFRKSEPFDFSHMVPHTARGHDLAKALLAYDQFSQPAWLDDATLKLLVDWEHRRWQLPTYHLDTVHGCMRLAKYIDAVVNALCPAMIVTTNKIDPPNYLFFLAARHYGIPYSFLERSPLNSYLIEDWGMFGESIVVESVIGELLKSKMTEEAESKRLLEVILGNPYGFRVEEASRDQFLTSADRRIPLFFLPLDNALWTGWAQRNHPQGDVDYPIFRTPDEALKACADVVEELGGRLVVKPHPSCVEWLRLEQLCPNVEFTTADLDQLCSEADVVVTFLTKVSYLALAKGKPVVSFGGGLLDHFGVTYQVKSKGQIKATMKDALAKASLSNRVERFVQLLPALEKFFVSDGRAAAGRFLKKMSPSRSLDAEQRQQLIVKAFKKPPVKKAPLLPRWVSTSEKPIVVFSCTRLINARLKHSGVSRYARMIVSGLSTDARITPIFVYKPQKHDHGMSAFHFQEFVDEMGIQLYKAEEVLKELESYGKPYVYHSPIEPLPNTADFPNMIKVITVHDIFHLTRPDLYTTGQFITGDVVNSINCDQDGIIFVSEFSRNEFIQYTDRKLAASAVTHLAVDRGYPAQSLRIGKSFLSELPADVRLMTFPYQGDPRKGFARMVEIANSWVLSASSNYVVVFGKSAHREAFIQSVSVLGNSRDKFLYVPDLDDGELAALYRRADLQLYLSEAEGFGLPPLEAMSCGCPSVMLANTSLAEVYKGWPLMCAHDATDDAILRMINQAMDSKNRARYRGEAQQFAAKYDWYETINQTVKFYLNAYMKFAPKEVSDASSSSTKH